MSKKAIATLNQALEIEAAHRRIAALEAERDRLRDALEDAVERFPGVLWGKKVRAVLAGEEQP